MSSPPRPPPIKFFFCGFCQSRWVLNKSPIDFARKKAMITLRLSPLGGGGGGRRKSPAGLPDGTLKPTSVTKSALDM